MRRNVFFTVVLALLLMLPLGGVLAQPEVVNQALADLNTRLGLALTLNDVNWDWSQNVYDDASLGCPQEGVAAAQVVTIGYQITFTYEQTLYDYRANEAGNLFLCLTSTSSAPTAQPLATPTFAAPSQDVIGVTTASAVAQLAQWDVIGRPILAWSVDGTSLAVTGGTPPSEDDAPGSDLLLFDAPLTVTTASRTVQLPAPITALAFGASADATFRVSGHEDGTVLLTPDNGDARVLEGAPTEILAAIRLLAIRPDGGQVAVVTEPRQGVYVWDTASGALIAYYAADLAINALAFSPDSTTLAWGDVRGFVSFAAPGAVDGVVSVEQISLTPVTALAYNPKQLIQLAVGSEDGLIRLWNTETRETVGILDNATDDNISALAFSPDGSVLAAAGGTVDGLTRDNSIRLWDTTTLNVLQGLPGHAAAVRALAFNPDGTRLASIADDDTLRLWGVSEAAG